MDKKILQNILDTKLYLYTIIVIFSILIIIPIIFQTLIIPSFKNQIVVNVLDESKRVANHLAYSIDFVNLDKKEIDYKLKAEMNQFQIDKVHFFRKDGKVIYSTIKEKIGSMNTHSYFHEIVAKGRSYFTIKHDGDSSSEDEKIKTDIIEIYIPILKNNKFQSAFELYYDISKEMNQFNELSSIIMKVNIFGSLLASFLLYIVAYITSRKNLEIKKYQEKLKTQAHTDALTNLYNRRYFFEMARFLMNVSQRNKEKISICIIDIDNFKKINDTYGHIMGDYVIKTLASELTALTRNSDMVVRYGGEEFVILFPNTDIYGAQSISNKICKHIEALTVSLDKIKLNFSISIGISEYKDAQCLDTFVHNADTALYTAKNSGKNRVVIE